jgi:hypothetical protein
MSVERFEKAVSKILTLIGTLNLTDQNMVLNEVKSTVIKEREAYLQELESTAAEVKKSLKELK